MPGAVFARDDRLTLRTVEREDLEFLQRGRNSPTVRRPLMLTNPTNGERATEFFEEYVSADDSVNLLACRDTTPVGVVNLFDVSQRDGTATVAYWIDADEQGLGYATEAVGLLCDHAFEDRRLHKLTATVVAPNTASQRVLEKLGFSEEGRLREENFYRGEHVDALLYGLLADEWLD